ncbi:synaptic vesicle 2-related protein-like isoform X2 [Dysidea avara]|uniref:synaptic vesicle 2-related protein-like isoform X2 n=1 Tax=Dysidea avara TaxID=196820 RepID=UPI003323796C
METGSEADESAGTTKEAGAGLLEHGDGDADDESRDTTDFYTVEDVVEQLGFGWYQLGITLFSGSLWVVFLGIMLGAPSWGLMADKFGRKWAMLAVNILISVFGVASSFSPNYYVLLLLRGIVGFGIGGGILGATYCTEFIPVRWRAVVLFALEFCWVLGTMFEAVLALLVMTNIHKHGWNWLLGLSAIPIIISTFVVPFVPESPRYLVCKGRVDKAAAILSRAAKFNNTRLPQGRLVTLEEKEHHLQLLKEQQKKVLLSEATPGSCVTVDTMLEDSATANESDSDIAMVTGVRYRKETPDYVATVDDINTDTVEMVSIVAESDKTELLSSPSSEDKETSQHASWIKDMMYRHYHWLLILFKHGWWKTTMLLWFIWFSANILYYGGTLMITALFQYNKHCGLVKDVNTTCHMLGRSDYERIVWTAAAEFPGILVVTGLLLVLGRKKSMAINTATIAMFYGLLFICVGKNILTVFLAGIRGLAAGFFMSVYLYTPEVYPTAIRAFGLSLCSAMSRMGGMTAPFIAQTIVPYNENIAIGLCLGLGVLASIACLLLPVETKGRALRDSGS